MPDQSGHEETRGVVSGKDGDWWLGPAAWAPKGRLVAYDAGMTRPVEGIRVREVRPGEITITREQLRRAVGHVTRRSKAEFLYWIEKELGLDACPEGQIEQGSVKE